MAIQTKESRTDYSNSPLWHSLTSKTISTMARRRSHGPRVHSTSLQTPPVPDFLQFHRPGISVAPGALRWVSWHGAIALTRCYQMSPVRYLSGIFVHSPKPEPVNSDFSAERMIPASVDPKSKRVLRVSGVVFSLSFVAPTQNLDPYGTGETRRDEASQTISLPISGGTVKSFEGRKLFDARAPHSACFWLRLEARVRDGCCAVRHRGVTPECVLAFPKSQNQLSLGTVGTSGRFDLIEARVVTG